MSGGNKQVPQIFFHNSPYPREYDLIHLTPYHKQPCTSQFFDITKTLNLQNFSQNKTTAYLL